MDSEYCDNGANPFVINHVKMHIEVVIEFITFEFEFCEDWYCPTGGLHANLLRNS